MAVENTTSTGQTPWYKQTSGVESVQDRTKLMKDDFLKLLVTQLQNQDPLNPADNQEFAAQLAQFSSLEQLTEMNDSMSATLESNKLIGELINNNVAANFLGKDVNAIGNQFTFDGDNEVTIGYNQKTVSVETTVGIYDTTGALVRTLDLGPKPSGAVDAAWDGKDNDGNLRRPGTYYFTVEAFDTEGAKIDTIPYMSGRVTGVRYVDNVPTLLLGERQVSLENVFDVLEPVVE